MYYARKFDCRNSAGGRQHRVLTATGHTLNECAYQVCRELGCTILPPDVEIVHQKTKGECSKLVTVMASEISEAW